LLVRENQKNSTAQGLVRARSACPILHEEVIVGWKIVLFYFAEPLESIDVSHGDNEVFHRPYRLKHDNFLGRDASRLGSQSSTSGGKCALQSFEPRRKALGLTLAGWKVRSAASPGLTSASFWLPRLRKKQQRAIRHYLALSRSRFIGLPSVPTDGAAHG
jgi:hypothetical protein